MMIVPGVRRTVLSNTAKVCRGIPFSKSYSSTNINGGVGVDNDRQEVKSIDSLINLNARLKKSFEPDTLISKPLPRFRKGYWADKTTSSIQSVNDPSPLPKETTMEKSYVQIEMPFEDDKALLENYIGGVRGRDGFSIRTGKLMEDLDTLAGSVAYLHCMPGIAIENVRSEAQKHGIYIVTAAVDRIDMLRPLRTDSPENLRLSGLVTYTGKTSMEVTIFMESVTKSIEKPETILVARFTMAVRDSKTSKSKQIPKLVIENEDQKALYLLGEQQKLRKKYLASQSLDHNPPNEEEIKMLHNIWMSDPEKFDSRNRYSNDQIVWMRDAAQTTTLMVHPQERNVHGKAFGGYLMRLAYESAWSLGVLFARSRVSLLALDELAFKAPVEIGSLLRLDTRVTFAPLQGSHKSFQVSVNASTIDLRSFEERQTNKFEFTLASGEPLNRYVLPKSYREGMEWLAAYRRRERGQNIRRLYGI